ncbi:HFL127Cp [Eremothecium sinecaudum]|uniref:HFL127Cp n=1 Tax=Eremothecium sinecaudum TaxID=45286 RepID=A0A0X8HUM4_9SACH|nr:HFL127Cp [Eremothecium sinecaudum]AMD21729.1 HFL127Cp [Eremothecium sinecaudum]
MFREFFQRFLNPQTPTFIELPGGFPEERTEEATSASSGNNIKDKILHCLITPPLLLLYFILSVTLFIIDTFKPIRKLVVFYDNNRFRNSEEYSNHYQALVDNIISDCGRYNLSAREPPTLGETHSFYSLYNTENGLLLPNMIQGGYSDLLKTCTEQGKFALIYIHDPMLPSPLEYVHRLLTSEEMINMIRRYQMLLWFGSVTTAEGLQVANYLRARQFPFIGFLTLKSETKLEFICRIEGKLFDFSLSSLESKLQAAYSKLLVLRQQRQNRELQRLVMEQQDYRYQQSLMRDQERSRASDEARLQEQQQQEEEGLKKQWLLWRKSVLHPEPTEGDICRLGIRTNTGRLVRKFDASLPIEEVYAFVELHLLGVLSNNETYEADSAPDYNYSYNFKLTTPVPRVELDPEKLIRDEAAIYPSGTVVYEQSDV